MRIAISVIILLAASTARASHVRVGEFNGAQVAGSFVVHDAADGTRATLTLYLSTRATTMSEIIVPLDISPDLAITAMTLAQNHDEPLVGDPKSAELAHAIYDETVSAMTDPALLEQAPHGTIGGDYRLRVFPVMKSMPARVRIELWLPGGATIDVVAGRLHKTVEVLGFPTIEPDDVRAVTPETSLVATHPIEQRRPRYARDPRTMGSGFHDHDPIIPTFVQRQPADVAATPARAGTPRATSKRS